MNLQNDLIEFDSTEANLFKEQNHDYYNDINIIIEKAMDIKDAYNNY